MRLIDLRSSRGSLVIANVRAEVSDTLNDVLGMWWRGRGGLTAKLRRRVPTLGPVAPIAPQTAAGLSTGRHGHAPPSSAGRDTLGAALDATNPLRVPLMARRQRLAPRSGAGPPRQTRRPPHGGSSPRPRCGRRRAPRRPTTPIGAGRAPMGCACEIGYHGGGVADRTPGRRAPGG